MTQDKFTITGDQLTGHGLTFDISALVSSKGEIDSGERGDRLIEMGEAIYLQGRDRILPSHDDRFDLYRAVETLRALAVIAGACFTGEHHRRAADVIARLLQEHERAL